MRRLIRYAGQEPGDRGWDGEAAAGRPGRRPLPVVRARELRSEGAPWREVAEILRWETGRRYQVDSVCRACRVAP